MSASAASVTTPAGVRQRKAASSLTTVTASPPSAPDGTSPSTPQPGPARKPQPHASGPRTEHWPRSEPAQHGSTAPMSECARAREAAQSPDPMGCTSPPAFRLNQTRPVVPPLSQNRVSRPPRSRSPSASPATHLTDPILVGQLMRQSHLLRRHPRQRAPSVEVHHHFPSRDRSHSKIAPPRYSTAPRTFAYGGPSPFVRMS